MIIQEKIQKYFISKTDEIIALSKQALTDHSGLKGDHRENILRLFLKDILPKRYSIDRGMVYGMIGKSREADIVIWDEMNYPKLKLSDSKIFFSEGVKAVIEVKSRWSCKEFEDIKTKTKAANQIFSTYREGLSGKIESIENNIRSLMSGVEYQGRLVVPFRNGTAAIIYQGGQRFDINDLSESEIERIEDEYPDIMLFLEAKKIVLKSFEIDEGNPFFGYGLLQQIKCKDDALLMFTSLLIDLLADRSEHLDPPLFLTDYLHGLYSVLEQKEVRFNITHPISGGSKTFWKE